MEVSKKIASWHLPLTRFNNLNLHTSSNPPISDTKLNSLRRLTRWLLIRAGFVIGLPKKILFNIGDDAK